jgi:acetyl esterase/lipase
LYKNPLLAVLFSLKTKHMTFYHNPVTDLRFAHPELIRQLFEIPGRMAVHWFKAPRTVPKQRFAYGKHRKQYLYLWENPDPTCQRLLFFVHGGGWRNGTPGMYPDVAAFFVEQGFHVVMPAYRLAPVYSHHSMMDDMEAALEATYQWAIGKGWNHIPMVMSGSSAGATLTAHLVFDRRRQEKRNLPGLHFTGFLSFAGPLDLDFMTPFSALHWYTRGEKGSAAFREANPVNHVSPDETLPVLLMHCPEDAIVSYQSSVSFAEKYPAQQAIELYAINGRTHSDSMRFAQDNQLMADKLMSWLSDK